MSKLLIGGVIAAVCVAASYALGKSITHAEFLAQCKSDEHGIRLEVGNKQYFYYCSYRP